VSIPVFELYARPEGQLAAEALHIETISQSAGLWGGTVRPHRHRDLWQLLLLVRGDAVLTVDGRDQPLRAAAVVAMPPLVVHGYAFEPAADGFVLTLPVPVVRAWLADAGEDEGLLAHVFVADGLGPEAKPLAAALARLHREFQQSRPGRILALRGLALLVLGELARLAPAPVDVPRDRAARHAGRFLELVDRHFREERRLSFYAGRLGITPTQLNRVCRRVLGRRAHEVLEERVLLEARRWLVYSAMDVGEIAFCLGFPDPSSFSRFFRRRAGEPPAAWRARMRARLRGGLQACSPEPAESSSARVSRASAKARLAVGTPQ